MFFISIFVVLMTAAPFLVQGHPTYCNQNNATLCEEGIKLEFMRRDYSFGDGYAARCPHGNASGDFYCHNPDTQRKTIASRFLKRDDFDPETIEQFLLIRWQTGAGYYKACGHYFNVEPFSMSRDLDNTHTIYYDHWILSHRPKIAFRATPGERYTLIAYDVGYLRLSGIWVNIEYGDTSISDEIYPHIGPTGGMWEIRNPQLYALFRQPNGQPITNIMALSDQIEQRVMNSADGTFDASVFIAEHNLQGPMAVGYLVVKADAFSIQTLKDRNVFNNCPYLYSKNRELIMALEVIGMKFNSDNYYRDYRGPFLRGLEMEMEITYRSPEAHYDSCCKHVMVPEQKFTIDSLCGDPIDSILMRYAPSIKLSPVEMQMTSFGMGKLYMLMLLDITEASVNKTNANTTIEWQVANIPGDNIGNGECVVAYRPPMARKAGEKRMYAFVLLRQTGEVNAEFMFPYTNPAGCEGPDASRCNFDLGKMEQYTGFRVASVATFFVEQDSYTRATMYGDAASTYGDNLNRPMMDKSMVCHGIDGFADPCPTRGCPNQGHPNNGTMPDHHGHNSTMSGHNSTMHNTTTIRPY